MKIATFSNIITPPVGTCVAGYGIKDVSVMKLDDLTLQGICIDDDGKKSSDNKLRSYRYGYRGRKSYPQTLC